MRLFRRKFLSTIKGLNTMNTAQALRMPIPVECQPCELDEYEQQTTIEALTQGSLFIQLDNFFTTEPYQLNHYYSNPPK